MASGDDQSGIARESLAAAFRALAGEAIKETVFQTVPVSSGSVLPPVSIDRTEKQAVLPIREPLTSEDLARTRGHYDAAALWMRLHNPHTHAELRGEGTAGEWLDRMERLRTELLGSQYYPGAAKNLEAAYVLRFYQHGYHDPARIKDLPMAEALEILLRAQEGQALPPEAARILKSWGAILDKKLAKQLPDVHTALEDQAQFARLMLQMMARLSLPHGASEQVETQDASAASASGEQEEQPAEDTLPGADAPMVEETASPAPAHPQHKAPLPKVASKPSEAEDESEIPSGAMPRYQVRQSNQPMAYRAYTVVYDEVVRADMLASPEELTRLRGQIDHRLAGLRDITHRLANRLQRRLLAQQLRSWEYNREEGMLDPSRLANLIIDPSFPTPYRWENPSRDKDTVVSLLIDNSGSMRGRPITVAALCADILARTLERCGVKVEVLGFTTVEWKGGQSRKDWLAAGNPPNPGRLNDIRHIVYKPAGAPWRRTRQHLGLMLKEGLLKENIDGEALLWAYQRLLARAENRKILMVISDGAPVDDSTLSANTGDYLDRHLRDVIHEIERAQAVELLAIGIGHHVGDYYSRAITIREIDELGDTMVSALTELFEQEPHARGRHRSQVA
ncbi:MAG: cobaltochelatase subunit CobT [Hyphomicrobiales bacterium]|nr:cobaltochelatase subunit CobT [Hyphomicrobiales bacterium]